MTEERAIAVGDTVWFKNDLEGVGVVVEIQTERGWNGEYKVYIIANPAHDSSPWHPMARDDYKHHCKTVVVEQDRVELY